MLPRDYITEDGFLITAKARRYLSPLIKGEDYPPYKDGLPQYVTLKNAPVKKKLRKSPLCYSPRPFFAAELLKEIFAYSHSTNVDNVRRSHGILPVGG